MGPPDPDCNPKFNAPRDRKPVENITQYNVWCDQILKTSNKPSSDTKLCNASQGGGDQHRWHYSSQSCYRQTHEQEWGRHWVKVNRKWPSIAAAEKTSVSEALWVSAPSWPSWQICLWVGEFLPPTVAGSTSGKGQLAALSWLCVGTLQTRPMYGELQEAVALLHRWLTLN